MRCLVAHQLLLCPLLRLVGGGGGGAASSPFRALALPMDSRPWAAPSVLVNQSQQDECGSQKRALLQGPRTAVFTTVLWMVSTRQQSRRD